MVNKLSVSEPLKFYCISFCYSLSSSWWYNVERKEADKQLLLPGNNTGTFLVREAGGKIQFGSFTQVDNQQLFTGKEKLFIKIIFPQQ